MRSNHVTIWIITACLIGIFFVPAVSLAAPGDSCLVDEACDQKKGELCKLDIGEITNTPCLDDQQCATVEGPSARCKTPDMCKGDPLNCENLHMCYILVGECIAVPSANQASEAAASDKDIKVKKPAMQIRIPGLQFGGTRLLIEDNKEFILFPWIGEYIKAVYLYLLGIAGLVVVIIFIHAGFEWLASGGNQTAITHAKKLMLNATLGLLAMFGSYTMLYALSPDLVSFEGIKVMAHQLIPIEFEEILDENLGGPGETITEYPTGPHKNPISNLLGLRTDSFPDLPECSNKLAQATGAALKQAQVCVGPCHCAYSASWFLKYINCTTRYSGNANSLVKYLEKDGWISEKVTSKNKHNIPVGLLWKSGHVGVSLGDGLEFQSGGGSLFKNFVKAAGQKQCKSKYYEVMEQQASTGVNVCAFCRT